jgi:hypothetical protein
VVDTADFGRRVMRWGRGHDAALARMRTITREEMAAAGVTLDVARAWLAFYRRVVELTPENPSAAGRAMLMEHAVRMLDTAP